MSPQKANKHLRKPGGRPSGGALRGGGGKGRAKSRGRGQKNRRTKVQHRRANLTASMVIDRSRQEFLSKYNIAPKKRKKSKGSESTHDGRRNGMTKKRKTEGKGSSSTSLFSGGGGRSVHLLPVCPTGNDEINEGELWASLRKHDLERMKDEERRLLSQKQSKSLSTHEKEASYPGGGEEQVVGLKGLDDREETNHDEGRRDEGNRTSRQSQNGVTPKKGDEKLLLMADPKDLTRNERRKLRLRRQREQEDSKSSCVLAGGGDVKKLRKGGMSVDESSEGCLASSSDYETSDNVKSVDLRDRNHDSEELCISSEGGSENYIRRKRDERTHAGVGCLEKQEGVETVRAAESDTQMMCLLTMKKYGSVKEVFEDDFVYQDFSKKDEEVEAEEVSSTGAHQKSHSNKSQMSADRKKNPVQNSFKKIEDKSAGCEGKRKRNEGGEETKKQSDLKRRREAHEQKQERKTGECPITRRKGETFASFARRVDTWTRETLRTGGGASLHSSDKASTKKTKKDIGSKQTFDVSEKFLGVSISHSRSADSRTQDLSYMQISRMQQQQQQSSQTKTVSAQGGPETPVWEKPAFGEVVDRPPELKQFKDVFARLKEKSHHHHHQSQENQKRLASSPRGEKVTVEDATEVGTLSQAESKVYLKQVQAAYAALKAKRRREAQEQMMNLGGGKRKHEKDSEGELSYSRPGWKEDMAAIHDLQWTGLGRYKPVNDEE